MTVRPVQILGPNSSVDYWYRAPDLRLRGPGFEFQSGPSLFLPSLYMHVLNRIKCLDSGVLMTPMMMQQRGWSGRCGPPCRRSCQRMTTSHMRQKHIRVTLKTENQSSIQSQRISTTSRKNLFVNTLYFCQNSVP